MASYSAQSHIHHTIHSIHYTALQNFHIQVEQTSEAIAKQVTRHSQNSHFQRNFLIGCSDKLAGVDFRFRVIWAI